MAKRHSIQASVREIKGKETKRLRRVGTLPGIVYGPVITDPISVQVDLKELDRMYFNYGSNLLIDLKVDNETYPVYMRTVTMNRIIREPQHVEFYAPNMRVQMTSSIPVMLTGELANQDGVIMLNHETIEVRGLPDALPSVFEVDISILEEIDQAIYVSDLPAIEDVEILTDPEEMIVRLNAPTIEVEEEVEELEGELDSQVVEGDEDAGEPTEDGENEDAEG